MLQVQDGVPIAKVARQAGASRQSVYAWIRRYEAGGLDRAPLAACPGRTLTGWSSSPCWAVLLFKKWIVL